MIIEPEVLDEDDEGGPSDVAEDEGLMRRAKRAVDAFEKFAGRAEITSRDQGQVKFQLWNTQRHLLTQIFIAFFSERPYITVLKCRQIGCSTVLLLFDLFWTFLNAGLQALVAADSDENREYFRSLLRENYDRLPKKMRPKFKVWNRYGAEFVNGSRMMFQSAGTKEKKTGATSQLGRSRGMSYVHATEIGTWGGVEALAALNAALSETNPARLYIFEGTANGFNHFYDMWQEAQAGVSHFPIFVTWWHHELYRVERDTSIFATYWAAYPQLEEKEQLQADELKRRFNVVLEPEQWAWYRWKFNEMMHGDDHKMNAEFPMLPEDAFQATGDSFFDAKTLVQVRRTLEPEPPPCVYCNYVFGTRIETTECVPATPATGTLTIWEDVEPDGLYIVSGDPAYGASEDSDRSIVQVWRGTKDQMIQVAEYCSSTVEMQQMAWVIVHLAGYYRQSSVIVELQGPGMGVWQELGRLGQEGWSSALPAQNLLRLVGQLNHYVWTRPDSIGGSLQWQWKTTQQTKMVALMRLREMIKAGRVVIRDPEFLAEMEALRQEGDVIKAHGRAHDDRIIGGGLAVQCWMEYVQPMAASRLPKERTPLAPEEAGQRILQAFFKQLLDPNRQQEGR